MKMKFFDFETYPTWWCVVVSDEEPNYRSSNYNYQFNRDEELIIKSKMRVYTSDDGEEGIKQYLADTSTGVLSGYNSKRFDMIIQKCVSLRFTPRQIFIAAQIITEKLEFPLEMQVTNQEITKISNYVKGWQAKWQGAEASQDLMDDSDKGLKDKEASYGMDIRETTVPFGKIELTDKDKADIIFYCKHDVFALHVHYICVAQPYIETKLDLAETHGLSAKVAYESTNAVLVGKALGAERVHGTTIVDPTLVIYEKPLREYLEKWVPKEALTHLLTSQKPKQLSMFGNKVFMADGGIHSTLILPTYGKEVAVYAEATEEYGLYNVDLSGCHPSVMCFAGAMPRSIKKPELFIQSVLGRRELKNKSKSQWTTTEKKLVRGWKLGHNTAYGAMGNKNLPLYDDYMRSKVCRVSQLIIIAVAMNLFDIHSAIKILQTNTDGILLYMPRHCLTEAKRRIAEFEALSNFKFELEEDSKIWQLNVNNYIALDINGKDKLKGKTFVQDIWQPGTNKVRPLGYHILGKAQYEFYVNGVNPIKFMLEHEEVADFAMSATKGPTYRGMIHTIYNQEYSLGKVARVIAVTNPKYGEVRKLKDNAKDLVANCPPHALIVNEALYNYYIEGNYADRAIVHKDGYREKLDILFYSKLLERVLDKTWYKLKDGTLAPTTQFNLEVFMKGANSNVS
jgi:hypothetical protein